MKCKWCGGPTHREKVQPNSTESIAVCNDADCGWNELEMCESREKCYHYNVYDLEELKQ